jgi:hypothetical protein
MKQQAQQSAITKKMWIAALLIAIPSFLFGYALAVSIGGAIVFLQIAETQCDI